ncbi:ABC transporter ATP-binding protein [Halobacillus litoralis]|uniref:ABC transporter ATP-binding protein n=1 Tax=Halobacillus litoralis TaxID=45668 RepID=UPI001CD66A54|nr:ABC transporter ATP-binding protein [Halobacillus litoralis]MCA0970975.1 ABC transporter ATP-binding protein [Halobacillus litoralis]
MDTVIEVKDIGISYPLSKKRKYSFRRKRDNVYWALKEINFTVKKGEVLGVLGRNGSGKSTLLKMLGGVLEPDIGEIEYHSGLPTLLSLGTGFNPELSGKENIYLNGLMLGHKKVEVDRNYEDIVEFSELGDFINEPIRTYSSGMKSRLAFSIAVTLNSDVILIDEVLGVGDQNFKEKSKKVILEKIEGNSTVIIVSHSASLIKSICDRVLWINNGKQEAFGKVSEIMPRYAEYMRSK